MDNDDLRNPVSVGTFIFFKSDDETVIKLSMGHGHHVCRGKTSMFEELWDCVITQLGRGKMCTSCGDLSFDPKPWGLCFSCSGAFICNVPNDDCGICREHLNTLPVCRTVCNHYFHIKCLMLLQDSQGSKEDREEWEIYCPLCRGIINPYNALRQECRIKNIISKGLTKETFYLPDY